MDETIQLELDKLKAQIAELTKKNDALEKAELARIKGQYKTFVREILEVVSQGSTLELNFEQLVEDMEDDELYIALTEANNPSADILGFRFVQIIWDLAQTHFLEELPVEDQPRFNRQLANAVKSPLLKVILHANPVTLMVSRVVEKVASFVKSIKVKKKGGGDINVLSVERAFTKEKLDNFITDLGKYVGFYDSLIQAAGNYKADKRKLATREEELKLLMGNYQENFYKILKVSTKNNADTLLEINDKFNPANLQDKNAFLAIMENEDNLKAHKIAVKFPELRNQINLFQAEYCQILHSFFQDNLKALEKAKAFSEDTNKLASLIEKINKKISSLKEEIEKTKATLSASE